MFSPNAYAEHSFIGDSDIFIPSSSTHFFTLSNSNGHLANNCHDNELQLLTQSFNCSSLDTARKSAAKLIKSSMAPQEGVIALDSFLSDNTGGGERKRSGKKDRHSKIVTAQGPRDRRMRLSLEIARKFFDLQDTLGFDKASKTVEWLMVKSKIAIEEITGLFQPPKAGGGHSCGAKSVSSTSECDATSGVDENNEDHEQEDASMEKCFSLPLANNPRCRKTRAVRRTAYQPQTKESRAMARARARERTKEKLQSWKLDKSKQCCQSDDQSRPRGGHHGKKSGLQSLEHHVQVPSSLTINDVVNKVTVPVSSCKSGLGPIFEYHHQQIAPHTRGVNSSGLVSLHSPDVIYNFVPQEWDMNTSATHASIRYC